MERVIGNPFDVELTGLSFEELDGLCLAVAALIVVATNIENDTFENDAIRVVMVNLNTGINDLIERIYQRMTAMDLTPDQRSALQSEIDSINASFIQHFEDWDVNAGQVH